MGKGGDNSKQQQQHNGNDDFLWSHTNEPHMQRRVAILKKYPEIKKLFGHDSTLKYKVCLVVTLQFYLAFLFRHQFTTSERRYSWWFFFLVAYAVGGTLNHNCTMALHELSHNLGFSRPKHNRWFAYFANLPLGVPAAVSFKRYHIDHHKYQGVDGIDVDIPTAIEGRIFNNVLTKAFFVCFQILFYAFRPMFVNPKPIVADEVLNAIIVVGVQILVFLAWGPSSVAYFFLCTLLGTGLHAAAGHFIAEHYVFPADRQEGHVNETYSYYGPVNVVNYNVGYHNEHHDFPFIPGSRLPRVRQIAAEFYDPLPHHTSYVHVLYSYIFNAKIGAFSRVKRHQTAPDADFAAEADSVVNKSQ